MTCRTHIPPCPQNREKTRARRPRFAVAHTPELHTPPLMSVRLVTFTWPAYADHVPFRPRCAEQQRRTRRPETPNSSPGRTVPKPRRRCRAAPAKQPIGIHKTAQNTMKPEKNPVEYWLIVVADARAARGPANTVRLQSCRCAAIHSRGYDRHPKSRTRYAADRLTPVPARRACLGRGSNLAARTGFHRVSFAAQMEAQTCPFPLAPCRSPAARTHAPQPGCRVKAAPNQVCPFCAAFTSARMPARTGSASPVRLHVAERSPYMVLRCRF
jgi:hypothetical protein